MREVHEGVSDLLHKILRAPGRVEAATIVKDAHERMSRMERDLADDLNACPTCGGVGTECRTCHGTGKEARRPMSRADYILSNRGEEV
jgi:hypothetical protein